MDKYKICSKCKLEKDIKEFSTHTARTKRQSWCKGCIAVHNKVSRHNWTDKQRKRSLKVKRRYNKRNKEKIRKTREEWKKTEKGKLYVLKNREARLPLESIAYAKERLCEGKLLKAADIPNALAELKRDQLILKRFINKKGEK